MTATISLPTAKAAYDVVMEVTPELASRWLDENTHNRPLNQAHVERLAQDMKAGRWKLTHQGIAFDSEGLLLDGQHRLWAVIEADTPATFRVFFNQPAENRQAVDCGRPRSNLDILTLTRQVDDVTSRHLATLRAMLAGLSVRAVCRSAGEEAEWFNRHRQAICFAAASLGPCGHRGVTTAQIRAVIARAFYTVNQQRLAHFCDVLRSGVPADESDHVIIALREFLMRSQSAGRGESAERLRYAKTEWALKAFVDGRVPKRLCSSDVELFPIPEAAATCQAKSA